MMRTIEVLIVIIILSGAFMMSSYFAVLPWPRQVSPVNLRRLALTTMQTLDSNNDLSRAAFEEENETLWNGLHVALSASMPPNVLYNMTVYEVNSDQNGATLYNSVKNVSNAESLGVTSDASSYLVASSNVTFDVTPEKIGERSGGGITLYILNCSDANGWWITGYTAQSLAEDLYRLLSPYFVQTVIVQNTSQLRQILDNIPLQGEVVQNAVVVNTFGEAVPIPTSYATQYPADTYAQYCNILGKKVNLYNWTWASIVGYPFYYVSNTGYFNGLTDQNTWGIYGMKCVGQAGLNAFLQGLDNQTYHYDDSSATSSVGVVTLTQDSLNYCNYYGIYPSSYQTSTRALNASILQNYNLSVGFQVFNQVGNYLPGAVYRHVFTGSTNTTGSFLALGLTRTPDIRVTGLSLLSYYQPRLYASDYSAHGTSRLVVLQLGLVGGV